MCYELLFLFFFNLKSIVYHKLIISRFNSSELYSNFYDVTFLHTIAVKTN